ncbi:MAG TPA: MATE family efflux transporter [Polyangiaceae bacterium]|nr:MATE family efflux transporter [Polyangiaceae bacterium]
MVSAGSLLRSLLRLAWPVALARLGIMAMSVVDVMVVGQFAPSQLPFQALGWAPIGVLTVSGIGLLTGVQVLGARALGANALHEAGGAWRRGLVVSLCAGAGALAFVWLLGGHLFTAFGVAPSLALPAARVARILALSVPLHFLYVTTAFFLESIQRPLASTVVMWGANLVNLLLNLWLVPSLGAEGSAWCTVGARGFLAAAVLLWVWNLDDAERFGVRQRATSPSYRALLRVGTAAFVSHAAEGGAFSGMTVLAGRQGGDAVAAYQILLNLTAIVFMVSLGVSSATAVLTSEAVGRKAPGAATRATFGGLALNIVLMLGAALFIFTFSRAIGRAYTANLSLAALISGLLWLVSLVLPVDGGQVVAASALRARGDNWFPTASHLVSYALVMPALAFWLAELRGNGVAGLLFAIFWSSVLSCSVLCLRLWFHAAQSKA